MIDRILDRMSLVAAGNAIPCSYWTLIHSFDIHTEQIRNPVCLCARHAEMKSDLNGSTELAVDQHMIGLPSFPMR